MNLFTFSGIFVAITGLGLGTFVLIKMWNSYAHRIWACFNICVGLWGLGVAFISCIDNAAMAMLTWRITHFAVIFIPVTFLHFTLLLLKKQWRMFVIILYIIGALFVLINITDILGFTSLFIVNMRWVFNSFYYDSPPGIAYWFFSFFFIVIVIIGHTVLLQGLRRAQGICKLQLKYLFYSLILAFSGGTTAFLPVFKIDFYPILTFMIAIYPLVTTYAITRYRFMDIKVIIRKSIIYGIVILILLLFVIGAGVGLEKILEIYLDINPIISVIAIMTLIVLIFPYIKEYLKDKLDLIFKKDYIDLSKKFDEFENLGFTPRYKISKFTRDVAKEIKRRLKLSKIDFLVLDYHGGIYKDYYPGEGKLACRVGDKWITAIQNSEGEILLKEELEQLEEKTSQLRDLIKALRRQKIEVVIPLKVDEDLLGVIMVGGKENDNSFSKEEIDYMQYAQSRSRMILSRLIMYEEALKRAMRLREEKDS